MSHSSSPGRSRKSSSTSVKNEAANFKPAKLTHTFGGSVKNDARQMTLATIILCTTELLMKTYYFVKKDGPTLRDRVGLQFPTAAAAIEHGKQLAQRLRGDPRFDDLGLYISVVDESGTEVYREKVYKGSDRQKSRLVNG